MTQPSQTSASIKFIFRLERASDTQRIEQIHEITFGPGRFARTAFRLRGEARADPDLCFVAECAGQVVSTVRLTPIEIGGQRALLLGPLAVLPTHANQGAGRKLVQMSIDAAAQKSETGILLVGDLAYYGPMGFERLKPKQVTLPGPVDPQRLLLAPLNGASVGSFQGQVTPTHDESDGYKR